MSLYYFKASYSKFIKPETLIFVSCYIANYNIKYNCIEGENNNLKRQRERKKQ